MSLPGGLVRSRREFIIPYPRRKSNPLFTKKLPEPAFFYTAGKERIAPGRPAYYNIINHFRKKEGQTLKRGEIKALFAQPECYTAEPVTVCGWVRTLRSGKALGFIELNDGSYFSNLQVVFEEDKLPNFDEIARQNVGAALIVRGRLLLTPQAKQPFEIHAEEITVEGASTPDYPLQKKRHTMEFLRTIQHLRPRTNTFSAAFRVRSVAAQGIHKFFTDRGFVYAHTPLITGSDC